MENKAERLYILAQKITEKIPDFFEVKGPGEGDHASNTFMKDLRYAARQLFGQDFSEKKFSENLKYSFDFYFPDEATVVEVALSLDKPLNEYERDIFKCLLAQESGFAIKRLVFVSKPGAKKKQSAPGPKAIAAWVEKQAGIEIQIRELQPTEAAS